MMKRDLQKEENHEIANHMYSGKAVQSIPT